MKAIAYDIMSYRKRDHPCWRNSRIGRDLKPEGICKKINRKTKGLLPVHFAGRPCEMSEILSLPHGLRTVEDCAHASETMYHGSHAGTFGDCGVLSFYSTKNLPTGDGGMILTDDDSLAAWFKLISQQGVTTVAWQRLSAGGYRHYDVAEIGFKYNMMDLQAAIGIHQLRRVERRWQRRQEIWNRYDDGLRDLPVELRSEPREGTRHALHLYTILIDKEKCGISCDEFMVRLHRDNIGVEVHYRQLADHSAYQNQFGWRTGTMAKRRTSEPADCFIAAFCQIDGQ